uniref:VWFA domain-containing protein n=1 Tax=Parastrongyloides trichosuri TaxID=131310 RepID=A0A0N4ZJQ1_PARTI
MQKQNLLILFLIHFSYESPIPSSTNDCKTFYTIFAVDHSLDGYETFDNQMLIMDTYFDLYNTRGLDIYFTAGGQDGEEEGEKFKTVTPGDTNSLNRLLSSISYAYPDVGRISYQPLLTDILSNNNIKNSRRNISNSALVVFIGSDIVNKMEVRDLILNKLGKQENLLVLGIVMDKQYYDAANYMIGGSERLFLYDYDDTNASQVVDFIVQNTCSNIVPPTTPRPPSSDPMCQSTEQICDVGVAADVSSDVLTPNNYLNEMGLILQSIPFEVPYLGRVGFFGYSDIGRYFYNISDVMTPKQFENALRTYKQHPGSSMTAAMDGLLELISSKNNSYRFTSYIYVSKVNTTETGGLIGKALTLSEAGALNFIVLDNSIPNGQLMVLKPDNIFYPYKYSDPDEKIQEFVSISLKCTTRINVCN